MWNIFEKKALSLKIIKYSILKVIYIKNVIGNNVTNRLWQILLYILFTLISYFPNLMLSIYFIYMYVFLLTSVLLSQFYFGEAFLFVLFIHDAYFCSIL